MKHSFIVLFLATVYFASSFAGNDYLWGDIHPNDYLIKKDTVSKAFFVGRSVSTKYVFKQQNDLNALTITGIRVVDKKKHGATAQLLSGGPGSKGVTIKFVSQKGKGISSVVEVYGR